MAQGVTPLEIEEALDETKDGRRFKKSPALFFHSRPESDFSDNLKRLFDLGMTYKEIKKHGFRILPNGGRMTWDVYKDTPLSHTFTTANLDSAINDMELPPQIRRPCKNRKRGRTQLQNQYSNQPEFNKSITSLSRALQQHIGSYISKKVSEKLDPAEGGSLRNTVKKRNTRRKKRVISRRYSK